MSNSVLVGFITSALFVGSALAADKTIVASASELDIDAYEITYDTATMTVSGPQGFVKQLNIDPKDAEIDFDKLGLLADGHYTYEIQYINNGGIEFVTDRTTGRDGSVRNLGKVEVKSGHFNVKNNEFISTLSESELSPVSSNTPSH